MAFAESAEIFDSTKSINRNKKTSEDIAGFFALV